MQIHSSFTVADQATGQCRLEMENEKIQANIGSIGNIYEGAFHLTGKLDERLAKHVDFLLERHPELAKIREEISDAYILMEGTYSNGGKLLIAGNGGSAADAEHIAGELMKRFKMPRPVPAGFADALKAVDLERGERMAKNLERGLVAIPLVSHEALTTAYINDVDGLGVFAQQLYGYGKPGDVFLGISTSGNSENILNAAVVARAMGMKVIGLTGERESRLSGIADIAVRVPGTETYLVQELHLPVYHCWCLMLEERFFGNPGCSDGCLAGRKPTCPAF